MVKSWHNRHISTKWGIAIIGFMLLSIVLLIPILGQNQDPRSNAMMKSESNSVSQSCSSIGGVCGRTCKSSSDYDAKIIYTKYGKSVTCSDIHSTCCVKTQKPQSGIVCQKGPRGDYASWCATGGMAIQYYANQGIYRERAVQLCTNSCNNNKCNPRRTVCN